MKRLLLAAVLPALTWGCGGEYIVTASDQVAVAGREAPVVVRLKRSEFYVISLPVEDAAISLEVDGMPERGAFTDDLGYAGTTVPAPPTPGVYNLHVSHSDVVGDEARAEVPFYVLDAEKPVIAVELDALPWLISPASEDAIRAVRTVAADANVVYMTTQDPAWHEQLHQWLRKGGYPDGPILRWQAEKWYIVPGIVEVPKIIVEPRLVSQLPLLTERMPNLTHGVGTSALAMDAFVEAGLTPVAVGGGGADAPSLVRRASWQALAEKGL